MQPPLSFQLPSKAFKEIITAENNFEIKHIISLRNNSKDDKRYKEDSRVPEIMKFHWKILKGSIFKLDNKWRMEEECWVVVCIVKF